MRLAPLTDDLSRQAATLLHEGFAARWPLAWPTLSTALGEVHEALSADRVAFAALDGDRLVGWISALPTDYGDQTWELHPLVVGLTDRGRGVGRLLVETLLEHLRQRGVMTVMLGTDDEDRMTSVGGVDLYPDVLGRLAAIEDRHGHPFAFYRHLGFEVVGIIPDANGPGRPDILMAIRLTPWPG